MRDLLNEWIQPGNLCNTHFLNIFIKKNKNEPDSTSENNGSIRVLVPRFLKAHFQEFFWILKNISWKDLLLSVFHKDDREAAENMLKMCYLHYICARDCERIEVAYNWKY